MNKEYDLSRFYAAHKDCYGRALAEIRQGRKESHWMWFIFPQIKGLGTSMTAQYYAIKNIEEARAFLADDYLKNHLFEICEALLEQGNHDALSVFGSPDHLKLHSSMTLFFLASQHPLFQKVLDCFFEDQLDQRTVQILNRRKKI